MDSIRSKLPPAEKALPAPWSRATRVSGSRSTARQMSASCRCTSGPTAFSPGPSMVMRSTPSAGRSRVSPANASYPSMCDPPIGEPSVLDVRLVVGRETEHLVDAGLGGLLVDVPRHRQLGGEDVPSLGVHRLLGGGELGRAQAGGEVPHHLGALVHVAGLQLLLVVLEPPRPVGGHPDVAHGEHVEDVGGILTGDGGTDAQIG